MATVLLIVIYFVFISLGLPDSILGSSWPAIATNLGVDTSMNGVLSIIVSIGTIISSFASSFMLKRFKSQYIVAFSIMLTICGLVMFSFVRSNYVWLFYLACIPLGLGAGAIDSVLNSYVSIHYQAIHMNWLHCTWGIGASTSPLIIGSFIDPSHHSSGWNLGVITIACIQGAILLITLLTLPLWNRVARKETEAEKDLDAAKNNYNLKSGLKNPILYLACLGFFFYSALEGGTGLWLSSFFKYSSQLDDSLCATLGSIFYIGITVGRFISGPLSLKLKEKTMIRLGEGVLLTGAVIACISILIPSQVFKSRWILSIIGFTIVGLGCAPIYPAIIRSTSYRLSIVAAPRLMGFELGFAYIAQMTIPSVFGRVVESLGNAYFVLPYLTLISGLLMLICHEIINSMLKKRDASLSAEQMKNYILPR